MAANGREATEGSKRANPAVRTKRMIGLEVEIVRFVDAHQPGFVLLHSRATDAHLQIDRHISRDELLGCFVHASTKLCDNQTRQPSTVHHFIARLVGRFYDQRAPRNLEAWTILGHSAARSQLRIEPTNRTNCLWSRACWVSSGCSTQWSTSASNNRWFAVQRRVRYSSRRQSSHALRCPR